MAASPTSAPPHSITREPADPELTNRQLTMAFRAAPTGMAVTTAHGEIVQANPALGALLGYRPEHLLGRRLAELANPDQAAAISAHQRQSTQHNGSRHAVIANLRHAHGHQVPVALSSSRTREPSTGQQNDSHSHGVTDYLVVHVLDNSERQATEADLMHRALHDPLTGLPNRALLQDRLDVALARLLRQPSTVAVLFCDLNKFKAVNDTHGHAAGDQVLIDFARRLRHLQRPGDTACRFGGDEFVVLCLDSGRTEADSVAARLHNALTAPVLLHPTAKDQPAEPLRIAVTASIGIATTSDPHHPAHQLLHDADSAMYQAKNNRTPPTTAQRQSTGQQ